MSECRAEKRIQMLIDRGIYNSREDILEAAMRLLIRDQMIEDSKSQAEDYLGLNSKAVGVYEE